MILISQGHFTFELTLAGLLEDILTRFKDERILLSLSDPAIGIRGDLFIAESTIFAARVEKPPIEGYAALRNLCQFAGAEFALSKYERTEPDPAKRSICIDLAKLIKSVPSLPVDPSSLFSSEALIDKAPITSVVGAPVVIAVPPMQLPSLPPPGTEFPQPDANSSSSAKQRIDQAFEAALQKRAAAKGKESPLAARKAAFAESFVESDSSTASPVADPQMGQPAPQNANGEQPRAVSKLAEAAAMLASASAQAQPPASTTAPAPLPATPIAPAPLALPVASPASRATTPLAPPSIPTRPPANVAAPNPNPPPVIVPTPATAPFQNAVGLGTGEIDWHSVRAAATRMEPISKEPTVSFSAEQIQQELAADDEEEEVAEPIHRQALKRSFVGPLAAVRLFTAKIGRLVLPVAVLIVVLQGGKLWLDSHGGSAAIKMPALDFLNAKPGKKAPATAIHKEATKPTHSSSHRDVASHFVSTHSGSVKSPTAHTPVAKTTAAATSTKNANVKGTASQFSSNSPSGTAKIVGTGSSKYPNSLIMRDQIKPGVDLPPRRHAYQTAPDAGETSK